MAGALSVHYAAALADSVFKPNSGLTPQEAIVQLRSAEELLTGSKQLEHALLSPAVSKTRKKTVIEKLAQEMGLNRLVRNFLLVVVSHRRVHELSAMRRSFEAEVDERLGWAPADISSTRDLTREEKEQIERALGAKLGKSIRATYHIDSSLIAGVRARVAAREYDATMKGRLESMRQRLSLRP